MNLKVEDLKFAYGRHAVLNAVSFTANEGELLSVLGPNGVGKSTLFRCILGILRDYMGHIYAGENDTKSLTQREMARRIAYIPQAHKPTFGYSVLDTVLMGTTHHMSVFSVPGEENIKRAREALAQIGIEELEQRDFSRLSGGQQQLVLIARALAQQAKILIMDEPTSSLDFGNQYRIMRRIRALAEDGYTVLLSTHNPQHALSYSHRILAMADGTVAALGQPEEVLTSELIRKLYNIEVEFAKADKRQVILPRGESI